MALSIQTEPPALGESLSLRLRKAAQKSPEIAPLLLEAATRLGDDPDPDDIALDTQRGVKHWTTWWASMDEGTRFVIWLLRVVDQQTRLICTLADAFTPDSPKRQKK